MPLDFIWIHKIIIVEILQILQSDAVARETVSRLENELGVYKRAYAGIEAERVCKEKIIFDLEKQKEDLEKQLKVNRQCDSRFLCSNPFLILRATVWLLSSMAMARSSVTSSSHRDNPEDMQLRKSYPTPLPITSITRTESIYISFGFMCSSTNVVSWIL